jgi:hypothetical protein
MDFTKVSHLDEKHFTFSCGSSVFYLNLVMASHEIYTIALKNKKKQHFFHLETTCPFFIEKNKS